MNRTGTTVAAGMIVILGGLLMVELYDSFRTQKMVSGGAASPFVMPIKRPVNAAGPTPARTAMLASVLLARPLFSLSRRPAAGPAPLAAAPPVLPRLSAIMISATKIAVFSPAGGKPIVVTEDDHIGAFTVKSITMQGVTVAGPAGSRVVHIGFSGSGP